MKYIYLLILCAIIALTAAFKNYKKECFCNLNKSPLKFLYGFSMLLISLSAAFTKNMQENSDKNHLSARLKAVSLGISAFSILIFFGLLFSISDGGFLKKNCAANNNSLKDSSLNISSSYGNSPTEKIQNPATDEATMENESYNQLKEVVSIFEKHRENIEKEFLGENPDLFAITKPLNLISNYGDENIQIKWTFEDKNLIDNSGNIIYKNIGSEGCSTLAYAALTLNGTTATLTLPIFICPP